MVVQHFSKRTKDKFWAGLWLEYEEYSQTRHTGHIAAAARAQLILERASIKKQIAEVKFNHMVENFFTVPPHFQKILPAESPESLSAPMTAQNIAFLRLRVAPSYFRLPNHACRFATQIFRGKSYEEAVAEQKANFNSWAREAKTRRVEGMPDHVVYGNRAVHKDDVPEFETETKQVPRRKRGYRDMKKVASESTEKNGS